MLRRWIRIKTLMEVRVKELEAELSDERHELKFRGWKRGFAGSLLGLNRDLIEAIEKEIARIEKKKEC